MFGELMSGLGDGLLATLKVAGPALVSGAVMKHGIKKLPNNAIPYLNGVLGMGLALGAGADPSTAVQAGIMTSISGTGTHQLLKVGARQLLDKYVPDSSRVKINGKLSI